MAVTTAPQYSRGRVSALGVFAEIDTVLARHRQKTSLAISPLLQEKIRVVLSTLGIKNIPPEKLNQIVAEIAQETTFQTLEDLAKVEMPEQIIVVLADNLTQAIINHPDLAGQIKADYSKVFTKVVLPSQEVYNQNQDVLEKAAVLANIATIAKLQDQTAQTQNIIRESAEQTVETIAPLTAPRQREAAKANLANYLKAYKEELATQLKITADNIPTLKELQNVKENAHTEATKKTASARPTQIGPKPAAALLTHSLTGNLAQVLYLRPKPPASAPLKLPTGGNLILSSPNRVRDAYFSLLAFDQEKLARALKETSSEIEQYKNKKSLTYKERLVYRDTLKRHARYTSAQAFHIKQPKKSKAYLTLFAPAYGGRPEVASGQAWVAENYFLPSMPRIIAHNERLAAGAAFGSLGFSFAGINFGSIFSSIKGRLAAGSMIGIGITPKSLVTNNPIASLARTLRNVAGATLGALYLLALGLGKAALMGAVIGSAIGMGAGAAFGVAILAPLGPIGWTAMPIVVPMTAAAGGLVGGVAGMLIGFGVAAGTATAISMGIGAGVGGTIGGIVGFNVGVAAGAATMTAAIGLCIGSAICAPFAPLLIAVSPTIVTMFGAVGATVGAFIGAAIGGAIGYAIGHYIISPVVAFAKGAFDAISSAFSGTGTTAGSAAAGFFSAAGSFFTGLTSTIWGGMTTAAGATLGFLSGAANFVIGLAGLGPSTALAAVPVVGGISAVAVGGTIVGIVTATSFFTPETDMEIGTQKPGENQFFTIAKTANPTKLENSDLPHDITFTITLTVKDTDLENVSVTDQLKVQKEKDSFTVTTDKDGQPFSPIPSCPTAIPAGGNCTYTFTITADQKFTDSVVNNTVRVTATPKGQSPITGEDTASVIIGNPPTCFTPCGWPTSGQITLGPNAGHHKEAIDIGNTYKTSLYSTMTGRISIVSYNDCTVQELIAGECGPNKLAGNFINVSGGGFRILYAHMDTISVSAGNDVTCGQQVGEMGYTGWTEPDDNPAGSHLHYDFKEGGKMAPPNIPQNPTVGLAVTAPPSCIPGE